MNRKKFLISASLAAISVSVFGKVKSIDDIFTGDCETTNDILGPFYRPGAPTRQNLIYKGLNGTKIELKGRVYGEDCITPLENALIEIWHCNTKGYYDNKGKDYNQRAQWYTNKNGEYSFKTILPGKYPTGKEYRPAHIHFRITEKNSKELISQIYFQGDPHIHTDPWASMEKAKSRILPITLEDSKGNLTVNFDIFLSKKDSQ